MASICICVKCFYTRGLSSTETWKMHWTDRGPKGECLCSEMPLCESGVPPALHEQTARWQCTQGRLHGNRNFACRVNLVGQFPSAVDGPAFSPETRTGHNDWRRGHSSGWYLLLYLVVAHLSPETTARQWLTSPQDVRPLFGMVVLVVRDGEGPVHIKISPRNPLCWRCETELHTGNHNVGRLLGVPEIYTYSGLTLRLGSRLFLKHGLLTKATHLLNQKLGGGGGGGGG